MKAQKKLNILLITLIIVLVSLVSFVGVFYQNKSQILNRVPAYMLGENVSGYRRITLKVKEDESSSEVKTETAGAESTNSVQNTSNEATTSEESKYGASDYRKSADIIRSRLKSLKVEDFTVSLDENTGKMEINIPENEQTDTILSDLSQKGNFQIIDSVTNEVLLSNSDVKSVNVHKEDNLSYSSIYMNVKFNSKGAKKFKTVTANYQNEVIEDTASDNETANNALAEGTNATNGTSSSEGSSQESSVKTKQVSIKIDDSTILTTHFSEIVDNGELVLTIGASSDNDEIQSNLFGGYNLAAIIENEAMPVQYEVDGNVYVQSNIASSKLNIIIYVEIAIAVIMIVYMIIRFKLRGILSSILSVGYLAILLLVIRHANVVLSLEGILAIELDFAMHIVFNYLLLKKIKDENKEMAIKKFDETIKNYYINIVPIAILSIVCCFVNWSPLYSFGMVMFWGIITSILYNLTFTNLLIRNN